jgi:hypothetical protein
MSICNSDFDWGEGKTNTPNSRDDVPPTLPPPVSLDPAEGGQRVPDNGDDTLKNG